MTSEMEIGYLVSPGKRNQYDVYTYEETDYEELTHLAMQDGKSRDFPSVGWRLSKASGVDQSESEGLRTRETNGVSHNLRAREDEMLCPSSSEQTGSKKANAAIFCCIQTLPPTLGRTVCSDSTNSKANLIQKHPQRHPECLIWVPHGQPS